MFKLKIWPVCVILTSWWLISCQQQAPVFICTDKIGCVTIKPDEPIKLGVLQDLSGGVAFVGTEQAHMVELVMAEQPLLLGHVVKLQQVDDTCTTEGGANAALRLVAEKQLLGIIGSTCSGAAVPAAKIMSEAGLVMISGANTAPDLTILNGKKGENAQPGFLRTVSNGQGVAKTAAIFAFKQLGITTAATLNSGDSYSLGYAEVFAQTFIELGGKIVMKAEVSREDTDMRPVLKAIAKAQPELLFFPLNRPQVDNVVIQATEVQGIEQLKLIVSLNVTDVFLEAIKPHGTGLYFAYQSKLKNPAIEQVNVAYQAKFGKAPVTANAPFAYDATQLLLKTIAQIAQKDDDGTLHIGRQALRDALYATKEFTGISGTLSCNQFGDCQAGKFDVMQLTDSTLKAIDVQNNVVYSYQDSQ